MSRFLKTKYWQAKLPDGWVGNTNFAENFAEMATIYSPAGVGMLRVFISDKAYDGTGVGEDFQAKLAGKYYAGRVYRGTFRRSWHLSCHGRLLSVTYSCAEQNAGLELSRVDEIIQNIDETGAAA